MSARKPSIKEVAALAGVSTATVSNVFSGRKPVNDDLLLETVQGCVRQHVKARQRSQVDHQARARYAQLSDREREVLGLILSGLTNKEMGRALQVSPRTVETHRANLFAKLEAESLAQLIRQYAALADREDGSA